RLGCDWRWSGDRPQVSSWKMPSTSVRILVKASFLADGQVGRTKETPRMKTVFVVGAGPAGLFAAQKIAQAGHQVVILHRDLKPGGLAEYGIYPTKDKMKVGLRKQFAKVLALPNVHYFGHVCIAEEGCLCIDELRQFNPSAIVFAVGAQGTKKLGLEGSSA